MMHGGDIYRNRVRMDFSVNLNPMGPPEAIAGLLEKANSRLSVYPDLHQAAVREAVAAYEGTTPDRVIAGNGASELFMAAIRAIRPGKALLFEPCYTGYAHVLRAADCEIYSAVLSEDAEFSLTVGDLRAMEETKPDVVLVCDPVNPTGRNLQEEVLLTLLDRAEELGIAVILDESFWLLSDGSEKEVGNRQRLFDGREKLYRIRSLTKTLALPGIRMGYTVSSPENTALLGRQLPEWNLSAAAEEIITGGLGILAGSDYLTESRKMIKRERFFLAGMLTNAGLKVYPSDTCFLLLKGPAGLSDAFLKRGILIRDCGEYGGLCEGTCRIAVKNHPENLLFAETLQEVLHEF